MDHKLHGLDESALDTALSPYYIERTRTGRREEGRNEGTALRKTSGKEKRNREREERTFY